MNERADLWPIMLRWLPAQPTMQDWTKTVDQHLRQKAELDRRKARPLPEQMETS